MESKTLAVLVTLVCSVVGVTGDCFLKLASQEKESLKTPWFYLGFGLYAATAFGWLYVMKHLKLATISVLYSVSMVLLLTLVGVVVFRESLSWAEIVGLGAGHRRSGAARSVCLDECRLSLRASDAHAAATYLGLSAESSSGLTMASFGGS